MKRILLTCFVALSIFSADAQTKSKASKSKKAKVTTESKAKAEFAKKEKERQEKFRLEREERLVMDSIRREEERLARDTFEMQRAAWTENRLRVIDSTNKENWKKQAEAREAAYQSDRIQNEVAKEAKLNSYQGRQIKYINQTYSDKARVVRENTEITDTEKKLQLTALNEERKEKIKAAIGKSKAKKLEKEQAKYFKKNGADPELSWIQEAENVAKN